jgi:hypothetical protein
LCFSDDRVGGGDGVGDGLDLADRLGADVLVGAWLGVAGGTGPAGWDVLGLPVVVGVRAGSVEAWTDGGVLGTRPAGGAEVVRGGADLLGGVPAGVEVRAIVPVTAAAVPVTASAAAAPATTKRPRRRRREGAGGAATRAVNIAR